MKPGGPYPVEDRGRLEERTRGDVANPRRPTQATEKLTTSLLVLPHEFATQSGQLEGKDAKPAHVLKKKVEPLIVRRSPQPGRRLEIMEILSPSGCQLGDQMGSGEDRQNLAQKKGTAEDVKRGQGRTSRGKEKTRSQRLLMGKEP